MKMSELPRVCWRSRLLIAASIVLGAIAASATASAQPPLRLGGEQLACEQSTVDPQVYPEICASGTPAISNLSCPASGVGSFTFTVSAVASGAYNGTVDETGVVTSGQLAELPAPFGHGIMVGPIAAIDITFTINGPFGLVLGTERMRSPSSDPVVTPGFASSPFVCASGVGASGVLLPPQDGDKACYVARLPGNSVDRGVTTLQAAGEVPDPPPDANLSVANAFLQRLTSQPGIGDCGPPPHPHH